jgi:excisionase family DNA binding protein
MELHMKYKTVEKLAYRVSEAVEATGIGRSKLYLLIKQGRLRTVKVGSITLIPASELLALVDLLSDVEEAA